MAGTSHIFLRVSVDRGKGNKRSAFASRVPRPLKRVAGSTPASATPLAVRTTGISIQPELDDYVRRRLGVRLSKFSPRIERATVRFEDVNGPRGGRDTACRIKVVLSGMTSVVVEQLARETREAFDLAVDAAERTVRRSLGRKGLTARHSTRAKGRALAPKRDTGPRPKRRPLPPPAKGSLIGRRVGRSEEQVEDLLDHTVAVDTSLPGWSATDRRAGGSSTAARNVKRRTRRAAATLEDSAQARPSRKSTRKSANRSKQDAGLRQRQTARATSPKTRARKAAAGA